VCSFYFFFCLPSACSVGDWNNSSQHVHTEPPHKCNHLWPPPSTLTRTIVLFTLGATSTFLYRLKIRATASVPVYLFYMMRSQGFVPLILLSLLPTTTPSLYLYFQPSRTMPITSCRRGNKTSHQKFNG